MNSNQRLISVIIIFYNAEKFLGQAIESIIAQTCQPWELLLVDDGSTDRSAEIARQYAAQLPEKLRYLTHEGRRNCGKSVSRNLGIRQARGDYLAFLDADDVYLPEKLERQAAILDAHPEATMVYGPTQYWFGWNGNPLDSRRNFIGRLGVRPDRLYHSPELLAHYLKDSGIVPGICSLLVRRQPVIDFGGFDERFPNLYEDQVFLAKCCLAGAVFVDDGCWDRYRQHPDSSSNIAIKNGEYHPANPNPARATFLDWLENYLIDRKISDPELWDALKKELSPYRYSAAGRLEGNIAQVARRTDQEIKRMAGKVLPGFLRRAIKYRVRREKLPASNGAINWGQLRRCQPLSRDFGFKRGFPVDRYYIEAFLARHRDDIRGNVLEIGDDSYTRKFGGERVMKRNIMHVSADNPAATIVGDLTNAEHIPSDLFDCFIITQTLHLIYDLPRALETIRRILKPGGVVLTTFPGISQISSDLWAENWCWSFTTLSARRMFEEVFPPDAIQIESFGNILAATAFLEGMAATELTAAELEHYDENCEFLITVRAKKCKPEK